MTPRQAHTLALLRALPRVRPRKRLPLQLPPKLIEAQYGQALLRFVEAARRAAAPLLDAAPGLLASAAYDRRTDAGEGRRIGDIADIVRDNLEESVTPEAIEELAREFAAKTSTWQRIQLQKQTRAALGADVFMSDRSVPAAVDGFVAENVALIRNVPRKIVGDIEQAVTRAVSSGTLHKDLAKEIDGIFAVGEKRAKLIARDQVGKLYGQINAGRQKDLGVEKFTWRSVHDSRVRPAHAAIDGKVFSYPDGHPTEGIPGTPILCFPGDTPVSADARVVKLYRRFYRGESAVVTTHEGAVLRATPNHPILTARGWVPAQLVEVGDYVRKASTQGAELLVENTEHGVPVLEQVFRALQPLGVRRTAAGFDGWFHGDRSDHDVDVVDMDGDLPFELDAALDQRFCQEILTRADQLTARPGEFLLGLDRPLSAAVPVVRGAGKLLALLVGRGSHPSEHRSAAIAWLDAVAQELSADSCARNIELLRDALHTPTASETSGDLVARVVARICRRAVDHATRRHAPSAQELAEAVALDAEHRGRFGDRVRREEFARVVENSVGELACHVYNLETESSWYVAHNLIVHNCRCFAEPSFDVLLAELDKL